MRLSARIKALESTNAPDWVNKPTHAILVADESYTEGLADYMARHPDKTISGDDNVIWIQLVSPELDENGSVIPRQKESSYEGPTLAAILAQMTRP